MNIGGEAFGETSEDLLLGQQLASRWELIRKLGAGGMGSVYEVRNLRDGLRAAAKLLARELADDDVYVARFRREVEVTRSFANPHVVRVFDHGAMADGLPFMVMEFLSGEDLQTRLERQVRLPMHEVLEFARGTAAALDEAHRLGVVHRDLKPANLFFHRDEQGERVKLLDFGLSRARRRNTAEGLTVFGQVLGTVWYMSPEQARGEEVTTAADVYALGVVIFQALAGRLPFDAPNPPEYLFRIQEGRPLALSQVAPELPLALDAILMRAMSLAPTDRPRTAGAFLQEFETVVEAASPRRRGSLGQMGTSMSPAIGSMSTSMTPAIPDDSGEEFIPNADATRVTALPPSSPPAPAPLQRALRGGPRAPAIDVVRSAAAPAEATRVTAVPEPEAEVRRGRSGPNPVPSGRRAAPGAEAPASDTVQAPLPAAVQERLRAEADGREVSTGGRNSKGVRKRPASAAPARGQNSKSSGGAPEGAPSEAGPRVDRQPVILGIALGAVLLGALALGIWLSR